MIRPIERVETIAFQLFDLGMERCAELEIASYRNVVLLGEIGDRVLALVDTILDDDGNIEWPRGNNLIALGYRKGVVCFLWRWRIPSQYDASKVDEVEIPGDVWTLDCSVKVPTP